MCSNIYPAIFVLDDSVNAQYIFYSGKKYPFGLPCFFGILLSSAMLNVIVSRVCKLKTPIFISQDFRIE